MSQPAKGRPGAGARTGARRRLAPQQRREELLQCALRVFARRGLAAARHAEIAAAAGTSVATTFVYFPTRGDLVGAVLDEVQRFYMDLTRECHDTSADVPHTLLEHALAFAASVDSHPDHARIWLEWSTSVRDEIWPRYLAYQDAVIAIVARTIARGQREGTIAADVDPLEMARLAVGAAHMIAQLKFAHSAPGDIASFLRTLLRALGSLADNDPS